MEADILLWIQNNIRNDILTPFMRGITFLGEAGWFWILLTVIFLLKRKYRSVGIASGIALFGSLILNNLILKNVVGRIRPYEVIDGLRLIGHQASDASFPSGHSAASFAAATAFFLMLPKRIGVLFIILAGLIAFSRLYIGIHYPTDVIFGIFDGILLGFCAVRFVRCRQKLEGLKNGD